jgi:putative endonuclease
MNVSDGSCPGRGAARSAAPLSRDRYRRITLDDSGSAKQRYTLRRARDTPMDQGYFVYVLANMPRGVLYVGVTNDLSRRIVEHRAKLVAGFTASYGITRLVHVEAYASVIEARSREHSLKRWRRAWKFELIEKDNPEWRDLSDDISS